MEQALIVEQVVLSNKAFYSNKAVSRRSGGVLGCSGDALGTLWTLWGWDALGALWHALGMFALGTLWGCSGTLWDALGML